MKLDLGDRVNIWTSSTMLSARLDAGHINHLQWWGRTAGVAAIPWNLLDDALREKSL